MDNVLQNQELRLSAFGEYLLKQRLVKEGPRAPWMCYAGSERQARQFMRVTRSATSCSH